MRVPELAASARTDDDGRFVFAALSPGSYTVEAAAPGYVEQSTGTVTVTSGAVRTVAFSLPPWPLLHDEILVLPSHLSLLREPPDSAFSLTREEIDSLPHLGGDVFRAIPLLPGTAANDVTAAFSIHGGRRDEVKTLLDGQELYDAFHLQDYDGALSLVPSRNLASASLLTGTFPASQGDRMGGILDLRTVAPRTPHGASVAVSVVDAVASASGRLPGGRRDGPTDERERGGWLVTARRGSIDLASQVIGDEDPSFWDLFAKLELDTGLGHVTGHALVTGDALTIDRSEDDNVERLATDYRSRYGWLTHRIDLGRRLAVETILLPGPSRARPLRRHQRREGELHPAGPPRLRRPVPDPVLEPGSAAGRHELPPGMEASDATTPASTTPTSSGRRS